MRITWSPQYEIGIGVIDNQHLRIVEYINEIYSTLEQGYDRESLQTLLHYLVDYTVSHFAFEEALMEQAVYRDIDIHKISHQTFIRQLETFQQRFDNGEDVALELANMLQNWLLKHIVDDDKSYCATVKEKILNQAPREHASWIKSATQRFFNGGG
jgi:hemerythrin